MEPRTTIQAGGDNVWISSLRLLERAGHPNVARLPYSLKVLLENLVRREDGRFVTADDIAALANWDPADKIEKEIAFMPARVLLQDFTGVPAVVDLAAMRDGIVRLGGDPKKVNPLQPVELVIDHSVQVDHFGAASAFDLNGALEYQRNRERYEFLRWGQNAFQNFRVVPPETGIVHQVNIEYLARVVVKEQRRQWPRVLPGHARRHRLAHDDGQRARRGRAGASAASKLKRRCSGSRSRCSSPRCSASSSKASCRKARPRPTSC